MEINKLKLELKDTINVVADYVCDRCERTTKNIPVQESIYNGAPLCEACQEEMSLEKICVI
jgi:hypothetical protein